MPEEPPSGEFLVNGSTAEVPLEPERSLLEVLRIELGLTGAKYGCGEGECGACTVLLDGEPVPACSVPLSEALGRNVVTIEGIGSLERLTPMQRAFVELGAFQCGFCTPGMIVRATALLARSAAPSPAEIRAAMEPQICRCGGYARILAAIQRGAEIARTERGTG